MSAYAVFDCDGCGEVGRVEPAACRVARVRKDLEREGWTFAGDMLCPTCATNRALGLSDADLPSAARLQP